MTSENKKANTKISFQPLELMGYFWLAFGIVVLFASFFVKETPRVPYLRGVMTNICAGLFLFISGVFSILKGRRNKMLEND